MKIGINAQILTDQRTGVTRYARNVIRLLPKIGDTHEFFIFGNSQTIKHDENNVVVVPPNMWVNSSSKRIIWEQTILPRLAKKYKIDLLFYPDHTASLWSKGVKQLITIHDLAPFAMQHTFSKMRMSYKQYAIKRSVHVVDAIISNSFFTKAEALRYFPDIKNKISVVHWGLENSIERVTNRTLKTEIQKRYSIRTPFLLSVGRLETRKNFVRLIKAFAKGRHKYGWKHTLVLVGEPAYGYYEIESVIKEEGIKDFVNITGYVKEEELTCFYSLADVFVYPSLYEGFGFPPLEAMKCGCPVVVSNVTSLPEVVGDAGILINPYKEDEMVEAIHRLIGDANMRSDLIKRGIERSKMFTWEKTVQEILSVMNRL
jgi:Glycosyltransferase